MQHYKALSLVHGLHDGNINHGRSHQASKIEAGRAHSEPVSLVSFFNMILLNHNSKAMSVFIG